MDSHAPTHSDLQPGPFISYSRHDQEFVRQLHDSLRGRGRDTWVDWEGILPTEEWMAKIKAAIDAAQVFVFIISPDSVVSTVCSEEIDHAVVQHKRLIPIVARDVDAAQPHEALRKLNWIYIRPSDEFEHKVDALVEAMDLDLGWVRDQSRLLIRAGEWEKAQREGSVLLRGRDLKDAERWLLSCGHDPKRQATARQVEYILASRQLENRRRTAVLVATVAALVIAIGLGIAAWIQRNTAKFEARVALARQLAAQSEMVRNQRADMLPRSLLLAVESMAGSPIHLLEPDQALRHAWESMPRVVSRLPHDDAMVDVAYSADGARLATVTAGGIARVWNAVTGSATGSGLKLDDKGVAIAFLPTDANRLITASSKSLQVWDAETGQKSGLPLEAPPGIVQGFAVSADGKYVASLGQTNEVRVWTLAGGTQQAVVDIKFSGQPHEQISTSGAFSPDGQYFAATRRGTLKVFEVGNWEQPAAEVALPAGGQMLPLAFSPDSQYLAVKLGSVVQLRRVREWGSVVASLESPDPVRGTAWNVSLAFSASGKYIAVGSGNGVATVWEVESKKAIATLRQEGELGVLHFSPRFDELLATYGEDRTARVWNVVDQRELARMTHGDAVSAIRFSPDARFLATVSADKMAIVWESTAQPAIAEVINQAGVVQAWISSDGQCLWAASGFVNQHSGSVSSRCWDGSDIESTPARTESEMSSFVSSSDGRFIAGSQGEAAVVWDTAKQKQIARIEHTVPLDWDAIKLRRQQRGGSFNAINADIRQMKATGSVRVEALSDDGRYLMTTRADDILRVWDARDQREILSVPYGGYVRVALSPRGAFAAATVSPERNTGSEAQEGDAIRVWELSSGTELKSLRHSREVEYFFFATDEATLVTLEAGGNTRVWSVRQGREVARFLHLGFVPPQLSLDGKYLVSRPDIQHARVWDAATGQPVSALLPAVPAGDPSALAFSRDAKRFAVGTTAGLVTVVGLPGGEVIAELSHTGTVAALAFSTDGKYLASGSEDATARILNIADNREVARVSHPGPVSSVRFSADDRGRYLATASNGTARASLWLPEDLRSEACRRVPGALPANVWSQYLGSSAPLGCTTLREQGKHPGNDTSGLRSNKDN